MSHRLTFGSLLVLSLGGIIGCGDRQANLTQVMPMVRFYFCGCNSCARTVPKIGSLRNGTEQFIYQGSLGDARDFGNRHRLGRPVSPDLKGEIAKKDGVITCPTIVVESQKRTTVFGNNGIEISSETITMIEELVRRKQA